MNIFAFFSQSICSPETTSFFLNILFIRPIIVSIILSKKDFSKEEQTFVFSVFSKFLDNPISAEDESLVRTTEKLLLDHSSANQLKEVREEIQHPTGQSNLPKLRKQNEKLTQQVIETQSTKRSFVVKFHQSSEELFIITSISLS